MLEICPRTPRLMRLCRGRFLLRLRVGELEWTIPQIEMDKFAWLFTAFVLAAFAGAQADAPALRERKG